MRPGSAPTYVRRWPRISASSRTPPRATRTNLRPMARATDSPRAGLPTPGGPHRARIAAAARVGQAPLAAELAHGQVFEDAVLHVLQAGVVGVQDPAGLADVQGVLRLLAPGELGHGVEPGPDPAVLGALLAGPLQPADLALDGGPHGLGHLALVDLAPVGADGVLALLALAEFLADGRQLLAQDELALRLLHALGDVLADLLFQ